MNVAACFILFPTCTGSLGRWQHVRPGLRVNFGEEFFKADGQITPFSAGSGLCQVDPSSTKEFARLCRTRSVHYHLNWT